MRKFGPVGRRLGSSQIGIGIAVFLTFRRTTQLMAKLPSLSGRFVVVNSVVHFSL